MYKRKKNVCNHKAAIKIDSKFFFFFFLTHTYKHKTMTEEMRNRNSQEQRRPNPKDPSLPNPHLCKAEPAEPFKIKSLNKLVLQQPLSVQRSISYKVPHKRIQLSMKISETQMVKTHKDSQRVPKTQDQIHPQEKKNRVTPYSYIYMYNSNYGQENSHK